jgi:NNP family nitrate/nitrite transporter-like MFS transporter
MDDAPRARWLVLSNVFAMNFFATGMAWTYVVVLVAPILADLGLSLRDWGTLWSGVSMGALLGALPAGALGDRFGVRRVVALGGLVMAATLAARALAPGFVSLLAAMLAFGVTLSIVATNLPKALGLWFLPSELGLANGVALGGNGAGQGLATFAAPLVLSETGGWRGLTFGIAAVVAALSLVWLGLVRDRAPSALGASESGAAAPGVGAALRIRDVWLVAGSYFCFLAGYIGVVGYLPTYLVTVQGLSASRAGLMLTVVLGSYVIGSLVLPPLSDRLGLRRAVYVPGILISGLMVFASSVFTGAPLVAVMVVWGFSAGAIALVFAVAVELPSVGPALAGSALGVTVLGGFLGGFLSPLLGLALAETVPLYAFLLFAGLYGASALLFFLLPETGSARRVTSPR